jgi:hypothetical protein
MQPANCRPSSGLEIEFDHTFMLPSFSHQLVYAFFGFGADVQNVKS